jgi:phosphatidylserine decarboxylase
MTVARDRGRRFLALGTPSWARLLALAGPGAIGLAACTRGRTRVVASAAAAAGAAAACVFRDPDRPPGGGAVLAPADGVVSEVERRQDGRVRVATFMRLTDVHVNRVPMSGRVRERRHLPGSHRPAFLSDAARNERMEWTIDTQLGELQLVQIAGAVARRIVPYRAPGEDVVCGERIGLIRFGSRVDVILPHGVQTSARVGQRVFAGLTPLDGPDARRRPATTE